MRNNYFLFIALFFSSFFITKFNSQTYILNVETFESSGLDIPDLWSESGFSTDGIWNVGSNIDVSSQFWNVPEHTQFAYSNDDACNCDKSLDRLILPEQDFTNYSESPVLVFDAFNDGEWGGISFIEVSLDGGLNFEIIDTISTNLYQWQNNLQYYLDFAGESSVTIAITYSDGGMINDSTSNWANGLAIDNVSIIESPTCFSPILTSLSKTDSSATIEWVEDSLSATAFLIQIGPEGFDPNIEGDSYYYISSIYSYTFTDLLENTTYDIYIKSVCQSPDQSLRAGPFTFRTYCSTITTSWSEDWSNFDGCLWNTYDTIIDDYDWYITVNGDYVINNYEASSSNDYLMSPAFACIENVSNRLMFDCKNLFHQFGEQYFDTLSVGIYDEYANNFLGILGTIVPDTNYTTYEYNLSEYEGQNIRFFVYSGVSLGPELNGISFVDNIVIDAWPPCPTPIDLVASTAVTSADISWISRGTETNWNIKYGIAGFNQNTGTLISVDSNHYIINGLNPGITYDFYIQANCGGDEGLSEWVGPSSFYMPFCVTPTNLLLDEIDSTSASITWSAGYSENLWEVEYGEIGFLPDSGTIADSNYYTLSGLVSGNTYEVYVRANCGNEGNSNWLGPLNFTTELTCTIDAPFVENFDDGFPNCWSQETQNDSLDWVIYSGSTLNQNTGPSDDYNGDGNYMYAEMVESSILNNAIMFTESYDISSITAPELKFHAHMKGLCVGALKINIIEADTSIEIFNISGNQGDNWMEYTIDLNPTSSIINFEIIAENDTAYEQSSQIGIPSTCVADIAIDEFGIDEKLLCHSPYNISRTSLSSSTVGFEWNTNPMITSWNYFIVEQGENIDSASSEIIYNDTILITGLTPSTNYDFYVKSDCDSLFQGPFSFSTQFSEDFGCMHSLQMFDSWGDGWNGASIDVLVNGMLVINAGTIESGSEGSLEFPADDTSEILLTNFVPGTYPQEVTFEITDGSGAVIFESGDLNADTVISSILYGSCPENDLKVINAFVPYGCDLTENEQVEIWLTNNGIEEETGFLLTYSYNGEQEVSEIFNDTLYPNDTLKYTFNELVNMSIPGNYEFVITCKLNSDIYTYNDSIFKTGNNTLTPDSPETFNYIACFGDTTDISVSSSPHFTVWYDSPTGGNLKGFGDVLSITDTSSVSYFAESRALSNLIYDDFESYNTGDSIAQNSVIWQTWSSGSIGGGDEDAIVTDSLYQDSSKCLLIVSGNDMVLPLSNEVFESGIITLNMDLNISNIGYFNFQPESINSLDWSYDVYFNNDTTYIVKDQSDTIFQTKYPGNSNWFNISFVLDIDNNFGEMFINNESKGFFNFNSTIASINFWAFQNVNYAIDNISASYVTSCHSARSESIITVGTTSTQKDIIVTCDTSFTWIDGITYFENNDSATYTYQTVLGCDSVIELDLTMITNKPSVTLNGNNLTCFRSGDGFIDVTIEGGTSPFITSWSNGSMSENINNLSSGTYEITVTDFYECVVSELITISEPDEIIVNLPVTSPSGCGTNDASISSYLYGGVPPFNYTWSNGLTSDSIGNLSAGFYSLTVVDSDGCIGVGSKNISSSEAPEISIIEKVEISCFGGNDGSISVDINGGVEPYNYNWDNGLDSLTINDLSSGIYTLTVTDSNDCVVTESIELSEADEITVEFLVSNPTDCGASNGEVIANAFGGSSPYIYIWENNADSIPSLIGLSQGIYNVDVIDADQCTTSGEVILTSSSAPTLVIDSGDESCFGSNDGYINVDLLGGTAPYLYSWDNGSDSSYISNLSSGDYFITVTDSNNCQNSKSISISSPGEIILSYYSTDLLCENENTGTIWGGVVSGGISPFNYQWNNGENTSSIEDLTYGSYELIVTDATACDVEETFIINQGLSPTISSITGDTIVGITSSNDYYVNGSRNSNYYWSVEYGEIFNQGDSLITILWDSVLTNTTINVVENTEDGCASDTISLNVEIVISTGLIDFNNEETFKIYPNPSNGEIFIDTRAYMGDLETEIFDMTGRSLKKGYGRRISILNYPDGLYILRVYYKQKFDDFRVIKN